MTFFIRLFLLCLIAVNALAQSSLPSCPASGKFHNCHGTYIFSNGNRYVGEWRENAPRGSGVMYFLNGDIYSGNFGWSKVGSYSSGSYTFRDGRPTIEASWDASNNLRKKVGNPLLGEEIIGSLPKPNTPASGLTSIDRFPINSPTQTVSANQSSLPPCQGDVSHWKNCFGTEKFSNGNKYVGEFKDGKRNGQGTLTYASGVKFVGGWLDGLRHGLGTEYRADETIVSSGRWERGIIDTEQLKKEITESERKEELRRDYLSRIQSLGGFKPQSSELNFKKFSNSYPSLLIAKIKPNLIFAEGIIGNPRTEIEVDIDPDGSILRRRIVQSSGSKAWDDAVLKAIDRTAVLPKDIDGRVPNKLVIGFRPLD